MLRIEERAWLVAFANHQHQLTRAGTPVMAVLGRTADFVRQFALSDETIAAAWLQLSPKDQVITGFGNAVANITQIITASSEPLEAENPFIIRRLARVSPQIQAVKVAQVMAYLEAVAGSPELVREYVPSAAQLLDALRMAEPALRIAAKKLLVRTMLKHADQFQPFVSLYPSNRQAVETLA